MDYLPQLGFATSTMARAGMASKRPFHANLHDHLSYPVLPATLQHLQVRLSVISSLVWAEFSHLGQLYSGRLWLMEAIGKWEKTTSTVMNTNKDVL